MLLFALSGARGRNAETAQNQQDSQKWDSQKSHEVSGFFGKIVPPKEPLSLQAADAAPVLDYDFKRDSGLLICPNCGGEHLHSKEVGQDHEERWQGGAVVVRFWCETCPGALALEIGQHKGNTFLRWRVGINPAWDPDNP